jgi:hypothetical protein
MRLSVLLCAVLLTACATTPVRVANRLPAADPAQASAECAAAKAEGAALANHSPEKVIATLGLGVLIGPGSATAYNVNDPAKMKRELLAEKIVAACTTLPAYSRAAPVAGQRWALNKGYDRKLAGRIAIGERRAEVFVHPTNNTLMLKPGKHEMAAQTWPAAYWPAVAAQFLAPIGCQVTEDRREVPFWEVAYVCPVGVDLPALARQQNSAMLAAKPLRR